MMSNARHVYFNAAQIRFATARQKIKTLIAGRGFGKSTLIALILYQMMRVLRRGKIFFSSTTVEQIKNSTLPPVIEKLAEMGIIEDKHFVVGKNPWAQGSRHAWFKRPISPVKEFDNVITFFNGFTVVLLSAAKPSGKRGGSYDAGIIDEAVFIKRAFFEQVLLKMIRGNLYRFSSWMHHSIIILSSQARTPEGKWVHEFELKAQKNPKTFLFMWESARANEAVLGPDWFAAQKQSSTDLDYQIEVENEKITQLPDGFYHKLDRSIHAYKPSKVLGKMTDIRSDEMLEASFDFSGKFQCASLWQEQGFVERCVRRFYAKDKSKIRALVDDMCNHLKAHEFKYIRLWGEPRGRDRNPIEQDDIFTIIQKQFALHGWTAEIMVPQGMSTKRHKERFTFMEIILDGQDMRLPKVLFNAEASEDVLISMENTDMLEDFTKNKSAERDPNFPQEHAPHFSDTVDYYLYYKHQWRLNDQVNLRAGSASSV
jgi:hypothetical protein